MLDGAVADDAYTMSLTGGDLPEQLQVGRMSQDGFQYFGVPALLGRAFGPSDAARVAVLSYHFWQSHFRGRADAIGKSLQLNREEYTVIGVMPPRFAWLGSERICSAGVFGRSAPACERLCARAGGRKRQGGGAGAAADARCLCEGDAGQFPSAVQSARGAHQ